MIKIIPNFISLAEQNAMIPLLGVNFVEKYSSKRYGKNLQGIVESEIPYHIQMIGKKLINEKLISFYNSVVVNGFAGEAGLPYHKDDARNGQTITVLTLKSPTKLFLRDGNTDVLIAEIPALSVYQLSDYSRWIEHSVHSKLPRISIIYLNIE